MHGDIELINKKMTKLSLVEYFFGILGINIDKTLLVYVF